MVKKESDSLLARKSFLILDYITGKNFFDRLYENFKNGKTRFEDFDEWIGTEAKPGFFWKLKDESHQIFRARKSASSLEDFFDFMISQIFHFGMVLKEYIYCHDVLSGDKGSRYAYIFEKYKSAFERSKILSEPAEMRGRLFDEINNLFKIANTFLVEDLLPAYKVNGLLTRRLILEKEKVSKSISSHSFEEILVKMHGDLDTAYIAAAQSLQADGFLREARELEEQFPS